MECYKDLLFCLSTFLVLGYCAGQNERINVVQNVDTQNRSTTVTANAPIGGSLINLGVITAHHIFKMRSYHATLIRHINQKTNELALRDYRLVGHIEAIHHFTTAEVEQKARALVQRGQMTLVFASDKDYRDTQGYGPEETLLGISSAPGTNTPLFLWNSDGFIPAPTSTSRILALMPTLRQQVCAMRKFVQEFGLSDIIILTQYPGKSQVDARECGSGEALIIDLNEGSMRNALRRIALTRTPNSMALKVIVLLTSHGTAKLVFEHAKSENMTQEGYLWLLSSGAVGEFKTWRIADQFPVGIFGMTYDTDITEVIKQSVDIWSRGVAKDLSRHSVLNMSSMYREIHAGSPSFKGFDDYGGYTGASVRILNLDNDRKWQEIGSWSYNSGVDMKTITWPGGIVSLPPTSPGGAVRCLNIFNQKQGRKDRRYPSHRRTHNRG